MTPSAPMTTMIPRPKDRLEKMPPPKTKIQALCSIVSNAPHLNLLSVIVHRETKNTNPLLKDATSATSDNDAAHQKMPQPNARNTNRKMIGKRRP